MAARWTLRPDVPRAEKKSVKISLPKPFVLSAVEPFHLMGYSPSSRDVSVGYFAILLVGFLLWIGYGAAAGLPALVIPNIVALLVGAAVIAVALRLRR
jgi:Flp pilus assembly protein TadB